MTNNLNMTKDGMKILLDLTFGNTATTYTNPANFSVSIDTVDVTFSDTALTTRVPIQGAELVDACNAITGWTTTGTVTVNATTYKPDGTTDGSLNLTKTDTSTATVYASKTTTSVDGTSKNFLVWFYIKDATALAKLKSSGTSFELRFGSDSSNYYYYTATTATLVVGWQYISIAIPGGFTGTTSSPSISALDYTYVAYITEAATATTSAGDFIFDAIRVASADDYIKAFDSVTIDESDSSVTTVSKLSVTEANGFLLNGIAHYNTDSTALMSLKGKYTATSKGTTDLLKITTKLKFRNIT